MAEKLYLTITLLVLQLTFVSSQNATDRSRLEAGEWNDLLQWDYWTEIASEDFTNAKHHWQWQETERYTVLVSNQQHVPIPNCGIILKDQNQNVLWKSKTDIDGRAELWAPKKITQPLTITISYAKNEWTLDQPLPYSKRINKIQIEADCPTNKLAELVFVIDATGSMKDEIQFLKNQIEQILTTASMVQPDLEIRSGIVFYRDAEESFLVRKMDLTGDINALMSYIALQPAAGGGDPTEAVETALDTAIQQLSWSDQALSRILFLWMDGPPKNTTSNIQSLQNSIKLANEKGIKIVPLMASGSDSNTEFLMRSLAIQTNGIFTFLHDASNINPNYQVPVTTSYNTVPLHDLLLKTISQQSSIPACEFINQSEQKDILAPDLQQNDQLSMKILCFPNPTDKTINIELSTEVDQLLIKNSFGQSLMTKQRMQKGLTKVLVEDWPTGIYFLQFRKDNYYNTQKLIVK